MDTHLPRSYRLTRPDGLGFFRRRSLSQFVLACVGLGLGLLALVVRVAGEDGRIALGVAGGVLVGLAFAKAPSGEEATELVGPVARFVRLVALRRHRFAAVLAPVGGTVPPLFAGISLLDLDAVRAGRSLGVAGLGVGGVGAAGLGGGGAVARERQVGLVVDRADGSVSVLLRVHGDGFLLLDDEERDGLVDRFGAALASVSRDDGVICRLS
ncbi:MAG: hypothetical protein M0Z46_20965 [Actinomycetota bacterium]|jgi:hypothetical protein|nr:hypothetical protein [Actinomycetota bacterium]